MKIRLKSGNKDERGKPLTEVKTTIKNNVQNRIDVDRSNERTKVTHKTYKNGKLIHEDDKK
ncbi:MAG: hypothetical protein ACE5J5_08650 [Candidatus Hydrothermarchaeales archaeon]